MARKIPFQASTDLLMDLQNTINLHSPFQLVHTLKGSQAKNRPKGKSGAGKFWQGKWGWLYIYFIYMY